MALKPFIKTLEEVAEPLREQYTQTDDGFILQVDETDYLARINEFRGNNIALQKQLKDATEHAEQFKNIDPAKYDEAVKTLQKLQEKQLLEAGQVDQVLEQRTQTMRADYEGRIKALTSKVEDYQQQATTYKGSLDRIAVESVITKAVTDIAPPIRGALEDIKLRAKDIWKVQPNGGLVPMEGDNILYGKAGTAPMTPEEWVMGLTQTAPYLFEPNQGGGSQGGGGRQQSADRVVPRGAFAANLEDIASGKKTVIGTDD